MDHTDVDVKRDITRSPTTNAKVWSIYFIHFLCRFLDEHGVFRFDQGWNMIKKLYFKF